MSFNATVGASAPLYETLYGGTDIASLSWAEKQWVAWYIWVGNPVIATGLMSFLLHEVRFPSFLKGIDLTFYSIGRVFRSMHTMDYCRLYPILSQVETPARKDTHPGRTMGMHKAGPTLALHH